MKDLNILNSKGEFVARYGPIATGLNLTVRKALKFSFKEKELHIIEIVMKSGVSVYIAPIKWKKVFYSEKATYNKLFTLEDTHKTWDDEEKKAFQKYVDDIKWTIEEDGVYTKSIKLLVEED